MTRFEPPPDPRPADRPWPQLRWPIADDVVLAGDSVLVRPADPDTDADALFTALDEDAAWTHVRGRPDDPGEWRTTILERRAAGWLPWVIESRVEIARRPPGTVVGTSSYLDVSVVDARLEIGATAYSRAFWATQVNPETKLLLLGYAFEQLGAGRVQLKTDIRNRRSAQAIARLGATYEGTLRRYNRRADDTVRDTVLFSILAEEWPSVQAGLRARVRSLATQTAGSTS